MSEAPRRILVVDDSADIRGFMRAALEHEGYRVALAENGREALDLQRDLMVITHHGHHGQFLWT